MNSTGFRGVRQSTDSTREKPFFARVRVGEQEFFSQRCATALEAALAYDNLARKHHGARAVFNFPPGHIEA